MATHVGSDLRRSFAYPLLRARLTARSDQVVQGFILSGLVTKDEHWTAFLGNMLWYLLKFLVIFFL